MFSKLFAWIKKLLSKLWKVLKVVIVVVLIALALWFTAGMALPAAWPIIGGMSGYWAAAAAAGAAFLFFPDETAELVGGAVEAVGDVLEDVAETAGDLLEVVGNTVLNQPIVWWALGAGALFLLLSRKKDSSAVVIDAGGKRQSRSLYEDA